MIELWSLKRNHGTDFKSKLKQPCYRNLFTMTLNGLSRYKAHCRGRFLHYSTNTTKKTVTVTCNVTVGHWFNSIFRCQLGYWLFLEKKKRKNSPADVKINKANQLLILSKGRTKVISLEYFLVSILSDLRVFKAPSVQAYSWTLYSPQDNIQDFRTSEDKAEEKSLMGSWFFFFFCSITSNVDLEIKCYQ